MPTDTRTNWIDAVLLMDCPKCQSTAKVKAKNCYEGSRFCDRCRAKSPRTAWTNPREEETQIYSITAANLIFSPKGRLSRKALLILWALGILPAVLLAAFDQRLATVLYCIGFWIFVAMPSAAKRLQDSGRSGDLVWFSPLFILVLAFVIPISVAFLVVLLVCLCLLWKKGNPNANRFGPPSSRIHWKREIKEARHITSTQPNRPMKIHGFSASIPEGTSTDEGYIKMVHGTVYSILLGNDTDEDCDVEVSIDGRSVGSWRLKSRWTLRLERPLHDSGCFTFYELGTVSGSKAGLIRGVDLGLVSVTFKPPIQEMPSLQSQALHAQAPSSAAVFSHLPEDSQDYKAGGTGLSGRSQQNFGRVAQLDYDESRFVTINLRLVAVVQDPRPLFPRSNPVPPPVS